MTTVNPKTETAVEVIQPGAHQAPAVMTPMDMIATAIANGAPIETMEKLMALQERWEANEARKAYVQAMAAFKKNPPKVTKNKHVSFESRTGQTEYDHATLDNVCGVLGAALAEHGLSYRWETEHAEGGVIRVTCVMTHVLGHSERTMLQAGADQSGGKNHVQAIGSTVTYLERYTLLAACGIATKDQDDDGYGANGNLTLNEVQIGILQDGLDETGGDIRAFCKFMKVDSLADIKVKDFPKAEAAIAAKRKKGAGQ